MNYMRRGFSPENVQAFNRRAILRAIDELGACSRKQISDFTGLDQATVTRAIAHLLGEKVVAEVGLVKGGRGRRSINLNFNQHTHRIVCVRLQRRSFSVGVFDLLGNPLDLTEAKIRRDSLPRTTFRRMIATIDAHLSTTEGEVIGLGIALPGPFLERDERIILMTESPEWQDFDIVHELRRRYADFPVHSNHDAKAAALAVWRERAKPLGSKVLLYISAGQGIGSGLVVNGQVFRGSLGIAGELGHTSIEVNGPRCKCGNHGCLELFTSRIALLRQIRKCASDNTDTSLTPDADFADLVAAFRAGDALAVAQVGTIARYLAQGITNCVNFVNPDLVVIGDEYVAFGTPFLDAIKEHMRTLILPSVYKSLRVELSEIAGDLVLMGSCLDVVTQTYLAEPPHEPIVRPLPVSA